MQLELRELPAETESNLLKDLLLVCRGRANAGMAHASGRQIHGSIPRVGASISKCAWQCMTMAHALLECNFADESNVMLLPTQQDVLMQVLRPIAIPRTV